MASARRRTVVVNLLLIGALLVGLAVAASALGGDPPGELEPTTAAVRRGSVIATVAASGEVVSPGEVGLDFGVAGTVVDVAVEIGDAVVAGQELATLDATALSEQVEVAEASLRAAEASLAQLRAGLPAQQRRLVDVQHRQAALQIEQAEAALARAEEQHELTLEELRTQVEQAAGELALAQDAHDAGLAVLDQQVSAASDARDRAQAVVDSACDPDPDVEGCLQAQTALAEAQAARSAARRARDQGRIREAQALQQAKSRLVQAEEALAVNRERFEVTVEEFDEQAEQARIALELVEAQAAVESVGARQGDLAQADAQVVQARVQLAQAARDLEDAVLRATSDGVVSEINIEVGDRVAGAGGVAEGSAVLLMGTADREVSGLFSEADATRIEVGQPAVVTFDALPGLSLNGHVKSIDVRPTVTGNLVRYGVKVSVQGLPDNVRMGQTSTLEIVVGQADGVLYVPTTTLRFEGDRTFVTVWDGETSIERDVEIGVRGDRHTEIVSGLDEDEVVVLPTRSDAEQFDIFGPPPQEPSTEPAASAGSS